MAQILTRTRLFIPKLRPELVSRPRLLEKLNAASGKKLILISAPAGYGKTTLLSEWIHQQSLRAGWISLDPAENDPGRFWAYVIASLQSIHIDLHENFPAAAKDHSKTDMGPFVMPLINQMTASDENFVLVLDDFHHINNQEILNALAYLLENLPPNMQLAIVSRSDPPLGLAKLRGHGELCEIRANDLRFTSEEAVHYLNTSIDLALSLEDITTLTEKTEGWIVGLQLAGISLLKNPDRHTFVRNFAGDNRYIADYLLDEALNRQPEHIQNFLLQTSILDLLSASLCDAVTERNDSRAILSEMEQANLFLVPLDEKGDWYRYHHLFAEILRKRLNQTSPNAKRHLYQRASFWFEQNQLHSEAVRLSLLSGDTARVAKLMEGYLLTIVSTSELTELNQLLRSLPQHEIAGDPWLALALAWGLAYEGEISSAQMLLEKADDGLKEADPAIRDQLAGRVMVLRAYLAGTIADYPSSIRFAQDALAKIPENDLSIRSFTILIIGNAFRFQGKLRDAIQYHQAALALSEKAGDTLLSVIVLSRMVDIYRITGQINLADKTGMDALEMVESHQKRTGVATFVEGYLKLRLSGVYYERNDLETALKFSETGMGLARQWGAYDSLSLGYFNFCEIYRALGDPETAKKYLQEFMEKYPFESRFQYQTARVYQAELAVQNGDIQSASDWVQSSERMVGDPIRFLQFKFYDVLAQVLIVQKKITDARALLDQLLKMAVEAGSVEDEIRTRGRMALIFHQQGDKKKALETITPALNLAAAGAYVRIFLDLGESIAPLLYFAALSGVQGDYCSRLLDHFNLQRQEIIVDDRILIEPLSTREMEVLGWIALGHTNQEIARELYLSLYTIKSHVRNIFAKLGVKNRTEAVARARLLGLLPQD